MAADETPSPEAAPEQLAQQELYRDIDSTFARIEHKIASERTAIDALLNRLTAGSA
jgi:hypothetical protein